MKNYEKAYKEALERAREFQKSKDGLCVLTAESIFPELQETEDERIRKAILELVRQSSEILDKQNQNNMIAWLEKQGEKKPIMNVPTREVILAIWDLGNEWKELTDGDISTKYGTQLDYIQKHWHESEYYLREKQGEKKPTWSEDDERIITALMEGFRYHQLFNPRFGEVPNAEIIDWIKSLKERFHERL